MPSIILSDNGVSSGSAGLKSTAASDGALALQTTTAGGSATTAVYVDTSQNVGIGTSSPTNKVSIVTASGSDGILSVKSPTTDTAGVTIDGGSTSNKGALLTFAKDATTKWRIGIDSAIGGGTSNNLNILGSSTDALLFGTNNTERARFNAGAPILCLAGGNTTATGTGIAFPATQSASSDANTLDDYEEGTFTPVLNFSNGTTGITYQNNGQQGTYVKVGRFVTVTIYIYLSNKGSSTGTMQISGLPFASDSSSPNYIDYYFPLGARNAFTLSAGQFPFFYLGTGSSQVVIYYTSLTTGGQPVQVTNTAAANLLELSLQFTYRTAS